MPIVQLSHDGRVIMLEGKEALLTGRYRSQWHVFKFWLIIQGLVTARISLHALAQQHNQMKTTVQLFVWCYKSWSNMIL